MKKSRWGIFIVMLLMLTVVWGCNSVPGDVIQPEEMARLLVDIHTGEGVVDIERSKYPNDSSKLMLKEAIYRKHGVTAAQVDSSMRWYGYHMDKYIEVYDRVIEIIENEITLAQSKTGTVEEPVNLSLEFEGDSTDVWTGVRYQRLSNKMPSNFIKFSLSNDHNWERGDVYELSSKLIKNKGVAVMSLVADYQDGTKEYVSVNRGGEGWKSVKLVLDSAKVAREVYGEIVYMPIAGEEAYIDSIRLIRTRWNPRDKILRQSQFKLNNRYGR